MQYKNYGRKQLEIKIKLDYEMIRTAVSAGVRRGLRDANIRNSMVEETTTGIIMNRIEHMLCEQKMVQLDASVHSQATTIEDSPLERAETPLQPKTAALDGANARQVGGQHYKGGIEHWDYVVSNQIPYLEAQIIKYVTRWRKKNGLQDLEKAGHFLQKAVEVGKEELNEKERAEGRFVDTFSNK